LLLRCFYRFFKCLFHRLGFWSFLLHWFFCYFRNIYLGSFFCWGRLCRLCCGASLSIQVDFAQYFYSLQFGSFTNDFLNFWFGFFFLLNLRSLLHRILFFGWLWFRFSLDGERLIVPFANGTVRCLLLSLRRGLEFLGQHIIMLHADRGMWVALYVKAFFCHGINDRRNTYVQLPGYLAQSHHFFF